jgi:hypothetical protein
MSNSKGKVAKTGDNNKVGKQEVPDQRSWPALTFQDSGLEALGYHGNRECMRHQDGAEDEQIATELPKSSQPDEDEDEKWLPAFYECDAMQAKMEDQSPAGVPVVPPQEVESDLRRKAFFTGTVAEIDARMEAGQQAFAQSLYGIEWFQRKKKK